MGEEVHGDDGGILLLSRGLICCFHSLYPEVESEQGRSQPRAGQVDPLGAVLGMKLA